MLQWILLCAYSGILSFGYYSYGDKLLINNYNNTFINVFRKKTGFHLSLSKPAKGTQIKVNSIYTYFPLDELGFIRMGYTRLNMGRIVALPRNYIGLDFYNPEFAFGVFKRHDYTDNNIFTLRTQITQNAKYQKLLITGDRNKHLCINFSGGIDKRDFLLEGSLSISRYISPALYIRKTLTTKKTALTVSLQKYFKNFYMGTRKTSPLLSINSSFYLKFLDNLTYNNHANFVDNNGFKNFVFQNNIEYRHPTLGVLNLSYTYANTGIPAISYIKDFHSIKFSFFLNPYRRSYTFHLKRKPLYIKLNRTIDKEVSSSRIFTSIDLWKFSQSLEYYYTDMKQYINSTTKFKMKHINIYQSVYYYTQDTFKNIRFTTGISTTNSLQIPALSSIQGKVYFDKNSNEVFDKVDKPINDIKVILDNERTTHTDKDGNFKFRFVNKGAHKIRIDLGLMPADYGSTDGNEKIIKTGFLDKKHVEFRISSLGNVKGRVFIDNNVNGIFDDHDLPLEGCIVSINGKRTWTWEKGVYKFSNVPPGSYTIKVEYCPQKVTPLNKDSYSIYVMPKDNITNLDFPFIEGEEIKVKVRKF